MKFIQVDWNVRLDDQNYFTDFQGTYTWYFMVFWEMQNSIMNYWKRKLIILLQKKFEWNQSPDDLLIHIEF